MFRALHDDEGIAVRVLRGDVPRRIRATRPTADAESTTLPERVALESPMPAEDLALRRLDRPGASRQEALDEFPERALADEADSGRVPFVEHGQAALARNGPDLGFLQSANGEITGSECARAELVQEIALVLVAIEPAEQARARRGSRVVPGRKAIGAEASRVGEPAAELDLAVAEHVGIRRAAGAQLVEEMREHTHAVFGGEVRAVQRDAELGADAPRILEVRGRGAVAGLVLLPVRHEQRLDLAAGIQQQQRRDRGVHPARERDDRAAHSCFRSASGWRAPAR